MTQEQVGLSTDHHPEREQERADAIEAIEQALVAIENEGREPDQWERVFLLQAIGWLFRGGYRIAAVDADLALTPRSERSRAANLRADPVINRCTIAVLRSAFTEAAARPVREFPAFGPIIFTQRG